MTRIQKRAEIILCELKKLYPHPKTILNFSNNWELLVAVMLSAQTTDKQVNVVTHTFFDKYKTIQDISNAQLDDIGNDLQSINYYKTKAKHIHETAHILLQNFNAQLPQYIDDMMTLPGVGRKTALVVLGNAYNIVEGIAVDTHVQRLSRVFTLTIHTQPEKIERDLQKLFPKTEWFNLTNRMINYGREYCHARCVHNTCPIVAKLRQENML